MVTGRGVLRRGAAVGGAIIVVSALWTVTAAPTRTGPVWFGSSDISAPEGTDGWLDRLNEVRALGGVPPVAEDDRLSDGAEEHARYQALNTAIGHDQVHGKPGFSAVGQEAARQSNVAVGDARTAASGFVDIWATAPFHAIAMLRPELTRAGYGQRVRGGKSYAALNVIAGLGGEYPTSGWPRVFPTGEGVDFLTYVGAEWPDPTVPCPRADTYGTPIVVDFGDQRIGAEPVTSAEASLVEDGDPLPVCVTTKADHGEHGWALGDRRVLVMPLRPLEPGRLYSGTVTTNVGNATVHFTTAGD